MAHLSRKGDLFIVRFQYRRREYKKSLKTHDSAAAKAALNIIELTIHRLLTGQLLLPPDVDPGDFILSGGTWTAPVEPPPPKPTLAVLEKEYLAAVKPKIAESYYNSQLIHFRHLKKFLGPRYDESVERITARDLNRFLEERLSLRKAITVVRERVTLLQLFKWAVAQEYLSTSPTEKLPILKAGSDRPPFRTREEIGRIIERGGLEPKELLKLWDCLYLAPADIAELLETVRTRAAVDYAPLMHAVAAYTGMRRGEILRLRWLDVDFVDRFVTARSRKQSRSQQEVHRRIDLHPDLQTILVAWKEQRPKGQFVICERKSLQSPSLPQAARAFWFPMRGTHWCLDNSRNLFKVGFHTYRHSFASNLAAAGVDQRIIDEFMGHTTEAMRRRYRHLFPSNRRSAIEALLIPAASVVESSIVPPRS